MSGSFKTTTNLVKQYLDLLRHFRATVVLYSENLIYETEATEKVRQGKGGVIYL